MRTKSMKTITTLIVSTIGFQLATTAAAQSREITAPAQKGPMAIVNTTLHNPPSEHDGADEIIIEDAWILFDEGRITGIGSGTLEDLDGYDVFDASGLHVYPGLIAGPTQLGLLETEQVRATDDRSELDNEHPEIQAWVSINPDSDLITVARSSGIMTALVFPEGGTISGQPSAIRLDGWTTEDLAIEESLGVIVKWPLIHPVSSRFSRRSGSDQSGRARERLKKIDTYFGDAEAWLAAKETDPTIPFNARFAALAGVIAGDAPLFIDASRASQIESAVAWSKRRGYNIVIVGGTASAECAPLLARHEVPVMIKGMHRLPMSRHADHDAVYRTPERLRKAGVLFSIGNGSGEPQHERNLAHQAGTAGAYGLPAGAALRSITLSPAEIVGIDDRLGSIEEGKSATLIITTGNPLEITSDVLVSFIDGRRIDLSNRQKTLVNKYREKYRQMGLIE
jgi:imidazolonepropionase-like amidohydrolase